MVSYQQFVTYLQLFESSKHPNLGECETGLKGFHVRHFLHKTLRKDFKMVVTRWCANKHFENEPE